MATFLQLARYVASDSGTFSGETGIASVTAQTGRAAKVVRWTNEAWRDIQNARSHWRWMRGEFSGSTIVSQQRYDGNDMGVSSRFGEFIADSDDIESADRVSVYLTATGQSDERPMEYVSWPRFYTQYMRGSEAATTGYPRVYTVDPAGKLAVYPIPDALYTLRGLYRKDVQELEANADTPEMPSRFHDLIRLNALIKLATHDEAMAQVPLWMRDASTLMGDLERDQLPKLRVGASLA